MDNEEDYIELHRLLAKCKWNMVNEDVNLNPSIEEHRLTIEYHGRQMLKINDFIADIPIIMKGDEKI